MNTSPGYIFKTMDEIWKPVDGYEGLYEVSTLGRCKRVARTYVSKGITFRLQEEILKPNSFSPYYLRTLCNRGKRKTHYMHRLVAIAFLENPHGKEEINHKNGIKTDNRVENLAWVTPSENVRHSWGAGLSKVSDKQREVGKRNGESFKKPVLMFTKDGLFVKRFASTKDAHLETGCWPIRTLKGSNGHTKGFIFKYEKND